jgi:alpha-glucosidase
MRRRRSLAICLAIFGLTVLAPSAYSGWASLGPMPAPERDGGSLVFRNAHGQVAISAVSPEVIRVRIALGPKFGRDHSYAIINRDLGGASEVQTSSSGGTSLLSTSALRVTITHDPFGIQVSTLAGDSLDADDPVRAMAFAGTETRVWKRLRDDEHIYGFGEKNGRLDKRGWKLGGYDYTMWNSDTYMYDADTDPIYVSVPFFMVLRSGRAHGIFLDNTHRTHFDVGHTLPSLLSFGAEGGALDYYFIDGPTPKQVIERYTRLTGRISLPPLWALAYHQCRWSYYPEAKVRDIARNFRERKIPADVIWLDIHHLDGYKPLTWDHERFPDPAKLIADLRKDGFRVVTIVDPHPKKEKGYAPYDSGLAGDHFVKNPDGSVYEAPVWPSEAEKNPGPSVFPDFSREATRQWWGALTAPLLDIGVAGIWNDMNEPAVFKTPSGTMPLDVRHDNEGQPTDHREIHNVYGMLMTRATSEGLQKLRPNARPFVLSRASFAGGQRYAAVWAGDSQTEWSHLRSSLPILMGMGLSGFAFVGSDIGGFAGAPSPELFTRWIQTGVFYPFMRTHAAIDNPPQEPWAYGPSYEAINRRAIELRYELLPYIYNVMKEAADTGVPAMRPLMLEYPDDEATYALEDEFLFGADLLVAPVLRAGLTQREVYLPKGEWYDFWSGTRYDGGAKIKVPVTLESLPIFVRAGAFIFRQPVVQHTGQMAGQPLMVDVYPAPGAAVSSKAVLYEDDGESLEYKAGKFLERTFEQRCGPAGCTVTVSPARGTYRPAARDLVVQMRVPGAPPRVVAVRDSYDGMKVDVPVARNR